MQKQIQTILIAGLLLGMTGSITYADSEFGAGFGTGLFTGSLFSAAASQPRKERVYVEKAPRRTQDMELKEELERKERRLKRKERELEEREDELRAYERRLREYEQKLINMEERLRRLEEKEKAQVPQQATGKTAAAAA